VAAPPAPPSDAPPSDAPLSAVISAGPTQLPVLRAALQQWLRRAGVPSDAEASVLIAADEAAAGAMAHGYRGTPMEEAPAVCLTASVEPGPVLLIEVTDRGRWHARADDARDRLHGTGLRLIEEQMDSVVVTRDEKGTSVVMRKRVRRAFAESAGQQAGTTSPNR
jgi:anti-sigma regulatory factor (Ser/Thr protein kinase)